MTTLKLKRAYDPSSPEDGWRVYIDRLWPRGLSKETFKYDLWDKSIAPSTELREWFHADPDTRWDGFETRYRAELISNPAFKQLADTLSSHPVVTLLFSSRDRVRDNAHILLDTLVGQYPEEFKADI
ncbi:MAG: DUF488 family protein [Duncaniella sp.]|nr:DUF488 family protein [Duncaniella sp.]